MQSTIARACLVAVLLLASMGLRPGHAGPSLVPDNETGLVLHAVDADRPWYPASLTKMMTAYVTFEAVKAGRLAWNEDAVVTAHAQAQPPVKAGLKVGQRMPISVAVRAMIVRSANDIAMVLAETVGGNEAAFVQLMNDTALRLGLTRTHFANPSGLPDPEQVTTARDMAMLARAIIRDYPEHAPIFAAHDVRIGRISFTTVNGLLVSVDGADGMKTGFTCAAGYNVVATATRDGQRLIAVVLGETSRAARSAKATALLESAFKDSLVGMWVHAPRLASMALTPSVPSAPVDLSKTVQSPVCGTRGPPIRRRGVTADKTKPTAGAPQQQAALTTQALPSGAKARKPAAAHGGPVTAAPARMIGETSH